ncbi:MAG: protein translocase subunit SecF, partial [Deltaproteobacteria bacterium CG17_big_fil_post_rev_8_21_14_2_50_63_7]
MQIVKPNTKFPFIPNQKPFLIASTVAVLLSLLAPFIIAPNLGTSFKGGTSIILHFEGDVSSEEVRNAFTRHADFSDVSVQGFGVAGSNSYMVKTSNTTPITCAELGTLETALPAGLEKAGFAGATLDLWPQCEGEGVRGDFSIRFTATTETVADPTLREPGSVTLDKASGITVDSVQTVIKAEGFDALVSFDPRTRKFAVRPVGLQSEVTAILAAAFPDRFDAENGLDEIVTVGADVGEKFRNDGIVSILFALGLILLYIAIRFDIRYAPGAVIALIHDVTITFGVITVAGMELTLETVAALLAIVGYSLNDTIVNFDRIRENVSSGSKEPLPEIVNRSINECLSRTILTSMTTVIAVLPLVFISTGVIHDFAITLVVGICVGTYSSVFVASPAMLWMDKWLEKRKARL